MKNKDVTKMPVIGTLITKVIKMKVSYGKSVSVPYELPSETYKIVSIEEIEDKKIYITNIWYKEHKMMPVIISEDMIKIYIPVAGLN